MRFSRQEYWGGFPVPSSRGSYRPRDQARVSYVSDLTAGFFTTSTTQEALYITYILSYYYNRKNTLPNLFVTCEFWFLLLETKASRITCAYTKSYKTQSSKYYMINTVHCHLSVENKKAKFIETESRMVASKGWRWEKWKDFGHRVQTPS